jgi:hypothetical protein
VSDIFIWTEAVGCAEILDPMLKSYCAHHDSPIHVYVYENELHLLPSHNLIIPVVIDGTSIGLDERELRNAYMYGHRGTALLWASIILESKLQMMIHLDADTVFLADVVTPIREKLKAGYSIVGTRRPYRFKGYKSRKYGDLIHKIYPDAVNTHCMGFNKSALRFNRELLAGLIEGKAKNKFIQRIFPVVDFFDRITFYLRSRGSVFYLDSKDQNRSGTHDRHGLVENSLISFAAVGSGCVYSKNSDIQTSETYKDFALRSYSLYSKHLLGKSLSYPELDSSFLKGKLSLLDQKSWKLNSNLKNNEY